MPLYDIHNNEENAKAEYLARLEDEQLDATMQNDATLINAVGIITVVGASARLYGRYNKLQGTANLAHNVDQLLNYNINVNTGKVTMVNP